MTRALIALLIVLTALVVGATLLQPRPLDYRLTLDPAGTQPFDTRLARALLPEWLGARVATSEAPPFLRLADPAVAGATYLFLAADFAPDAAEAERLQAFMAEGGTVFIAAERLSGPLAVALGAPEGEGLRIRPRPGRMPFGQAAALRGDSVLALVAPGLARPGGYHLPVASHAGVLDGLDPARTTLLGTTAEGEPVFVRIREGAGQALVLTTPVPFTNAALALDGDGAELLGGLLAYVPAGRPVLWDVRYAPFRPPGGLLRVVRASPPLRWALWLGVAGVLLYVVFRGRRWQRPIPVVAPPPNAQRTFARTIGRIHFLRNDRAWLADRIAQHFLGHLRRRLYLPEPDLSDETARRAAARTGVPEAEALALFHDLRQAQARPNATDLVALDRRCLAFCATHDDAAARRPRPLPAPTDA